MLPPSKLLLVDDEEAIRTVYAMILTQEGLSVHTVPTGWAALQALANDKYDLILLDIDLPDISGLTVLEQISVHYTQISPIIITGYATLQAAVQAQELGAEGFILKPFDDVKLLQILRRIMERRKLREDYAKLQALVQTEKLAALGRLSASLAHEINNPLQALRSGLRLLGRPHLDETKRQSYVATMVKEVERLIGITTQTLDFARPSRVGKKPIDLNLLLQETITLVNKQLQHNRIEVVLEITSNLPSTQVVPDQIKQVFLNLILNAIDAMAGGGQLNLSTAWAKDDHFVQVTFKDTGCGMSPEILNKIYEPFFSTKEAGTGLGLSISYSIVQAHGGSVAVESEPGSGSCFYVYLPTCEDVEGSDGFPCS